MRNVLLLLQKQFYEDRKGLLIYASVVFGLFLIPTLVLGFFGQISGEANSEGYFGMFVNLLFIGGFIMISMTFSNDMYNKVKQHAWLMLPVHAHEKLIAKEIYHAIIYPVVLLVFIFLTSAIVEGLNSILFGYAGEILSPFDPTAWKVILHYVITSSVFMMGATYFRSAHFVKTLLALMLLSIVLGIFATIFGRIIYAPYKDLMFNGGIHINIDETMLMLDPKAQNLAKIIEVVGKTIYWALLAPFCLVVSYFRIREVEAKDAV